MTAIRSTDVTCPKCGARTGNWCVGAAGNWLTNSHRERVLEARKRAAA